jgi:hypothetical protein
METVTVTAFKLGQSTVITLPKTLNIKPGTQLNLEKTDQGYKMTPHTKVQAQQDLATVQKGAGIFKGPTLTLEELSQMYDEDTYGDLLS